MKSTDLVRNEEEPQRTRRTQRKTRVTSVLLCDPLRPLRLTLRRWFRGATRALSFAILAASTSALPGAQETILIRAARVHPVSSGPIENGEILVAGGKIAAVGRSLALPSGARVIEVPGEVFPGLIEGGAALGGGADEFRELTPHLRVAAGLDRDSRVFERALQGGVTTAAVTPGGRNVIGGLGVVVKIRPGRRAQQDVRVDAFLSASLTAESFAGNMNLRGSAPFTFYHRIPTTRMGTVFLLRRSFFEALGLALPAGLEAPEESTLGQFLDRSGKETLAETLCGARPLRVRARERQEIEAALRLASEFRVPVVIEGFGEGADSIGALSSSRSSVLLSPLDVSIEVPFDLTRPALRDAHRLPALLDAAGIEWAFASGSAAETPLLRERLGLSLRSGLTAGRALRAATLDAARLLGVSDRTGSIEAGKDADLVAVGGGGPLDLASRVEWVMVEGELLGQETGATR